MRRLLFLVLLLCLGHPSGAAPLPEVTVELGDVPPSLRDDAMNIWNEHAAAVQERLWPFALAPQPVTIHLLDSAAYREWTAGWLGDWTVGAAGADWIALDGQRLRAVGQTLEKVLIHEYAHCLIRQGAGERADVPRWFHEGVAQRVAHEWRVDDTIALILDGGAPDLRTLERGLDGGSGAGVFYRSSLLAASRLEERYGPDVFRDLILSLRTTGDFRTAFSRVTGESYDAFATDFDGSVRVRFGWLFLITRWPTLFVLAALMFLLGAVLKRRRDRRRLEAMPEDPPPPEPEPLRVEDVGRRLWPLSDDEPGGRPH